MVSHTAAHIIHRNEETVVLRPTILFSRSLIPFLFIVSIYFVSYSCLLVVQNSNCVDVSLYLLKIFLDKSYILRILILVIKGHKSGLFQKLFLYYHVQSWVALPKIASECNIHIRVKVSSKRLEYTASAVSRLLTQQASVSSHRPSYIGLNTTASFVCAAFSLQVVTDHSIHEAGAKWTVVE